jgi:undecaprenyl diphosphate synthase
VAIIMDGNGRWATRRGLPRAAGHRAGVAAVRRVVERAPDVGITRLTLYAFSCDNWRRPTVEVQSIFWLLRAFLRLETERLRQRGVRIQIIGRRDRLADSVLREIDKAECSPDLLGPMLTKALTGESGEVDLLIRTGGETRLSDFLLWECAYAELLFTERMWPDFDAADLDAALEEFKRRERRFGGVQAIAAATI